MSPHDFQLWMYLYSATGLCCAIACVLSVIRVASGVVSEQLWRTTRGLRAWLLLVPILWWRWQKTYLLTTPVTLGIVTLFGFSLPWGQ